MPSNQGAELDAPPTRAVPPPPPPSQGLDSRVLLRRGHGAGEANQVRSSYRCAAGVKLAKKWRICVQVRSSDDAPQVLKFKNGAFVCSSAILHSRRPASIIGWLYLSQLLRTNSVTTTDKSIRPHPEGTLTGRKQKKYTNIVYCQLRARTK